MENNTNELLIMIQSLDNYQIESLTKQVKDLIITNEEAESYHFDRCPKCGVIEPILGTRGTTKAGKQMLECKSCHKRFVYDHGKLTFYSHKNISQWNDVIKYTIQGVSLLLTASYTNIRPDTVFRMKHKILHAIETLSSLEVLDEVIELDEKYVDFCHKGKKMPEIDKIVKESKKRGLSNNECCLLTGYSRNNSCFSTIVNMGAPKSTDIVDGLYYHIAPESIILVDGNTSYNKIVEETHSSNIVLKTHKSYDFQNHLNNINSFHSQIANSLRNYRNVSSKYLRRYGALFSLLWTQLDIEISEIVQRLLIKIKRSFSYIRIKDLKLGPNELEQELCQQIAS